MTEPTVSITYSLTSSQSRQECERRKGKDGFGVRTLAMGHWSLQMHLRISMPVQSPGCPSVQVAGVVSEKKPPQQDLQILLLYFSCRGKQHDHERNANCARI